MPELRAVRGDLIHRGNGRPLPEGTHPLGDGARGQTLELEAVLRARTARELGLEVRVGADQATVIGYDVRAQELYVDRTRSGDAGFSSRFPGVQRAPLRLRNGELRLRILMDRSSVEVFADRGQVVLTDQVFPDGQRGGQRAPLPPPSLDLAAVMQRVGRSRRPARPPRITPIRPRRTSRAGGAGRP